MSGHWALKALTLRHRSAKFAWSWHFVGPGSVQLAWSPHFVGPGKSNSLGPCILSAQGMSNLLGPRILSAQGVSNLLGPPSLSHHPNRLENLVDKSSINQIQAKRLNYRSGKSSGRAIPTDSN